MLVNEMRKQGEWLFAWRSYVPVPIYLGGLALVLWGGRAVPGSDATLYGWLCLAVAGAGAAFRFYVRGIVPAGTSGRNVRGQVASTLNTDGAYSIVRHPLYVGNFLIYFGICLYPGVWWFAALVVLLFWLYYERIMMAEEAFLAGKFGDAYAEWSERVPAFVPRLSGWKGAEAPFRAALALRRERSSIMGVGLGFGVYVLAERLSAGATAMAAADWVWATIAAASVALYAVGKLALRKR